MTTATKPKRRSRTKPKSEISSNARESLREARRKAADEGDPVALATCEGRDKISEAILASVRGFRDRDHTEYEAAIDLLRQAISRFRAAADACNPIEPLVDPESMRAPYRPRPKPDTAPEIVEDGRKGTVFWKGDFNGDGRAVLERGDGAEPLFRARDVIAEEAMAYAVLNGHEFKET